MMKPVAVAIVCKTPAPGQSKTRLSPPLLPEECPAISACFIRDLSQTIQSLAGDGGVQGCAVYTPSGSEAALRRLLPDAFELILQGEGGLGARLLKATAESGVISPGTSQLVSYDLATEFLERHLLR